MRVRPLFRPNQQPVVAKQPATPIASVQTRLSTVSLAPADLFAAVEAVDPDIATAADWGVTDGDLRPGVE
eukprot:1052700-Rhodomonas_salina.1